MNIIIYNQPSEQWMNSAKNIIKHYEPEKLFAIWADKELADKYPMKCTESYLHYDCFHGDYSKYIEGDNIIPADNALLKALEPYMVMVLKQIERNTVQDLSFEGRMSLAVRCLEYWNTIIQRHNISLFIMGNIPHLVYDYIIYGLCKIHGIPCVFSYLSKIYDISYNLSDIENCLPEIKEEYLRLRQEYKDKPIEDIKLSEKLMLCYENQTNKNIDATPEFMKLQKKAAKLRGVKRILNIIKLIFTHGITSIINAIKYKYKELKYYFSQDGKYQRKWESLCQEPNLNKRFVYFPLHYQPECTTNPIGGYFVWQAMAIKMLSYALPDDAVIYVKENPIQTQRGRSYTFIDELCAIKKVVLVSKSYDTYKLIESCTAVASITGTALWECMFSLKPGIMFGNFYTEYAPGIHKVQTNEECKAAVDDILQNGATHTLKDAKLFLLAMDKICYNSFTFSMAGVKADDIEQLSEILTDNLIASIDKQL